MLGFGASSLAQLNPGESADASAFEQPAQDTLTRPNIVLILADDLGFSDIASYGGEINTPTLSAMAQDGVSFTNYHTAASCAPSRAMLLTGVNSHLAGVPNIPEMIPPEQSRHANYQGTLGRNVVTVATLLRDAGYHTYMSGKWHLGQTQDLLPSARGFERTVALADSGADNWEQKPYLPIYDKANWFADGKEYQLPKDFYSSRFLVDKAIEFIDSNAADGKPFFTYLPFQAVHMPVQAPQEFIDRYMGVYDAGWTVLRQRRLAGAIALGIVPAETAMVDMATTANWSELSDERQRYEAKRMAVYGAMVEAMDHHIGRLIEHLKNIGQYDNTVFIFTSDNGSEASGSANQNSFLGRRALASQGYSVDYDTLGLKGSMNTISPSFASASAAPLSYYKFYVGEGGMRVPLIISGTSVAHKQQLTHAFAYATDIAPTIVQLAGATAPSGYYGGRSVESMTGRNLMPLLRGEVDRVYSAQDWVGYELAGHGALFQGDYKIVFNRPPAGDSQWRLFNIVTDPGETQDLSAEMPSRLQDMLALFAQFERENSVLPVAPNYNATQQVAINGLQKKFGPNILIAILTLLVLVTFYFAYRLNNSR
ncbi:MAG: arylsulfatase [Halioglobus sp.]